jgi:predicted ATPase/class 3 adenylate cyclase
MTETAGSGDPEARGPLPVGTVTFLRTDIEGSMALARALGSGWDAVNATHMGILRAAVEAHRGVVVRTEGDALFAVFPEAGAAVRAAVDAQRAIGSHGWPASAAVRVRIGIHSGEAHLAGDDYGGFDVNRAARIAAVGHGGQVILSGPTFELVADRLPPATATRPLGRFVLKDVIRPESLYQLDIDGLPTAFPTLRAGRVVEGNLGQRLTSFVGRDRELEALRHLLERARLVTLTGPGGIGKTTLATEVARSVEDGYADGAWVVPLASIDSSDGVAPLIARTIGLFDGPFRLAVDTLPIFLADRAMLLVLDNFEHVIDAADVVGRLLQASPHSRFIATSRAPLHISGEHEYPVGPLAVGGVDDAAVRLFVDRAQAVQPGWTPGTETSVVEEIVTRLDGLPLGVELAAARVSLLPLQAIRDRLAARLPLPGAGARDAPARQRTLDGAVAWSHDLLTPDLQTRLHRLSVFEGGFDLAEAGPVALDPAERSREVLDDLAELVDRSLLQRVPEAAGVRFRMLQTIQAFGAARLAETDDEAPVRRRHAETYLALAEAVKAHEDGADQRAWRARLDRDDANLRAAIDWSIEHGEVDLALRFVGASWRYWQSSGHLNEGRALADRALAIPGADAPTTARMWAASAAGSIAYWRSDSASAGRWYEEELSLARALGDGAGLADALFNLGHVEFVLNAPRGDAFRGGIEETVRAYEAVGDERGVARTRWAVGNVLLEGGDPAAAYQAFIESRASFEALGDVRYVALSSGSLAWTSFALGDIPGSFRWTAHAIRETYSGGDLGSTTISLHIGVLIAVIAGRPDEAARISGAFDALCERYGVRPPAALERFLHVQDPFAMARDALSPERYAIEYAVGQRMSLAEAVDLVVELASTTEPAIADGPPAQ